MAAITVRNLPDEVYRALKARAAAHGRSTEAEVGRILEDALTPQERVALGSFLARIGRDAGGVEFEPAREQSGSDPTDLP